MPGFPPGDGEGTGLGGNRRNGRASSVMTGRWVKTSDQQLISEAVDRLAQGPDRALLHLCQPSDRDNEF